MGTRSNAGPLLAGALVLSGISFAAEILGFGAYRLLGAANQAGVQVPVTLVAGAGGMVAWLAGAGRIHRLRLERDGVLLLPVGVLASVALFAGVHRLLTGYLTAPGNLVAVALIFAAQLLIALPVTAALRRPPTTAS